MDERTGIGGLTGPDVLRSRAGTQYGSATLLLGGLIQVLAFGLFMVTLIDGAATLGWRSPVLPQALYTLGSIIFVTYIQMATYPLLRWTLALPDICLIFLAGIAQCAAAITLYHPDLWWWTIVVLHLAAAAAYLYPLLRLRPFHLEGATESYRRLRRGLPLIGLSHGVITLLAAAMAIGPYKGLVATWVVVEVVSIATVIIQVRHETWLTGLFREMGLDRY